MDSKPIEIKVPDEVQRLKMEAATQLAIAMAELARALNVSNTVVNVSDVVISSAGVGISIERVP